MDTDDLSDKAYSIIVHAARVCDTLKAELGALSLGCENEVAWLHRVGNRLRKIVEDPDGPAVGPQDQVLFPGVNQEVVVVGGRSPGPLRPGGFRARAAHCPHEA